MRAANFEGPGEAFAGGTIVTGRADGFFLILAFIALFTAAGSLATDVNGEDGGDEAC